MGWGLRGGDCGVGTVGLGSEGGDCRSWVLTERWC